MVALPLETWTAGASPKKFGKVYSRPIASADGDHERIFQSG
jgi:hypothetical protein